MINKIEVWMLDFRNIMSLELRKVGKYLLDYVIGNEHTELIPLMIKFPA